MATRSTINLSIGQNDKYRHVYCHFDGYLEHVGRTLFLHYNTIDKINNLMDCGNLEVLGKTTTKSKFISGEKSILCSIKDIELQEYNYFFKDGRWYYTTDDIYRLYPINNESFNWKIIKAMRDFSRAVRDETVDITFEIIK